MTQIHNTDYKRPVSVIVVMHDDQGRMLLLKRVDIGDFWQSVTGSLKWDERPSDAARREVFEETGITDMRNLRDWHRTQTFEILPVFRPRYAPGIRHNIEHMFSLKVPRDAQIALNPREHSAYQWQWPTAAVAIVWSRTNRDAITSVAMDLTK